LLADANAIVQFDSVLLQLLSLLFSFLFVSEDLLVLFLVSAFIHVFATAFIHNYILKRNAHKKGWWEEDEGTIKSSKEDEELIKFI